MDRNGNFDYRSLFYPGPAPLPVQIYPVNGDARFPFLNMATRGDPASPAAREDTAAPASPPVGGRGSSDSMVARRRDTARAPTPPPPKLGHVIQGLSHLLDQATGFCESCLSKHAKVVALASFSGHATRNALWRELVGSCLEDNGVHKDLLATLVQRVRRYTAQAQQAVRGGDEGEGEDARYRLALMADRLSASCDLVGRANDKVMLSSIACESMVELMREMLELCKKMVPGVDEGAAAQDGQEGGDRQY